MAIQLRKAIIIAAVGLSAAGLGTALEAGKPKKAPPPPPPPPPPPYVFVAWKPIPPEWASPNLSYRPLGPDGVRLSPNRGISAAQTLWNLRSAYNVAALNCRDPKHAEILANYKVFLKAHAKTLRAANTKVDAEFRARYGAGFVKHREKFMTEVYNHFALPPVLPAFCNAALAMSKDAKVVKSANLSAFATTAIPNLEIVFDDFFKRYDQYRLDMAAWEAKWGKDAPQGTRVLASSIPIVNPVVAAPK